MSESDHHELYLRYIDAINARQFDRMHEFAHEELVFNGHQVAREDFVATMKGQMDAVRDFVWSLQDLVVEGDRAAAHLTNTGTPVKTWLGLEPTGASVKFNEYAFYRFRDGRFYEVWYLHDAQAIEQQLHGNGR